MGLKHPQAAPMKEVVRKDITMSEVHLCTLVWMGVRYFGSLFGLDMVGNSDDIII